MYLSKKPLFSKKRKDFKNRKKKIRNKLNNNNWKIFEGLLESLLNIYAVILVTPQSQNRGLFQSDFSSNKSLKVKSILRKGFPITKIFRIPMSTQSKFWRIFHQQLFYFDINSIIMNNSHLSGSFHIKQGVRQGCLLSPSIFT